MIDIKSIPEKELYNRIIRKLKEKFGSIPETGMIAGQAVASAVYEITRMGYEGPYRDLDIYITGEQLKDLLKNPARAEIGEDALLSGDGSGRTKSGNAGIFTATISSFDLNHIINVDSLERHNYSIISCFIDPLEQQHNYVVISGDAHNNYHMSSSGEQLTGLSTIIESFDINCCQIGIDLKTKQVYWTPEFENFLYRNELAITNLLTPAHSAIRLAKKHEDMPWAKFDIKRNFGILQTARKIVEIAEIESESNGHGKYFAGHLFADVTLQKFHAHGNVLYDYFSPEKRSVTYDDANINQKLTKDFYVLRPSQWDKKSIDLIRRFSNATGISPSKGNGESPGFRRFYIEDVLFYANKIIDIASKPSWKLDSLESLLDILEKEQCDKEGSFCLLHDLLINDYRSFKGLTASALKRCANFFSAHPRMSVITACKMDSATVNGFVANMRWCEKNDMRYVIGEFEDELARTFSPHFIRTTKFRSEKFASPDIKDDLLKKHNAKLERMGSNYVESVFTKAINAISNANFTIRELCSEADLFLEGERVKHCVGGYWENVKYGSSHIFSIIKREVLHP